MNSKRNRLRKLENLFNIKIYESEHQIVYRGINHDLIKDHINSKVQKVLCIYDTKENFLKAKLNYNSDRLAFYEIYNEVDNALIIYRHSKIDEGYSWPEIFSKKPFSIVEGKEKSNNKIVTSPRPNVYPAPQPKI